jgi:hypothetical protein
LYRQSLLDLDYDAAPRFQRGHGPVDDPVAGISLIGWHTRIGAANLNPAAPNHADANDIVQSDRLVYGPQVVEAIRAPRPNAQTQIDLGKRAETDTHDRIRSLRFMFLVIPSMFLVIPAREESDFSMWPANGRFLAALKMTSSDCNQR